MMLAHTSVEEYLRFPIWMQGLLVLAIAVVGLLAILDVVDDTSDWIVLGGILVAVFGLMIAANNRRYPTRKRSFSRDSDSRW